MDRLIIIGAGGHGRVAVDIADKMGVYSEIVFLDDGSFTECLGYRVIGKIADAKKYIADHEFFVALGNTDARLDVMHELSAIEARFATLIHPSAIIGKNVKIGEGTVVMAGAVINPCSVIGDGCIINTMASVDHDCVIGDYVHVSVGARICGAVNIEAKTWIGAGAVIRNGISVCEGCTIGVSAAVVKNITEPGTYVGVPAKKR